MNAWPKPDKKLLIRWIMDAARRTLVHYGLWLREVDHQFGLPTALEIEKEAGDASLAIMLNRLSKVLGFELKDGVPAALEAMDEDRLTRLLDALAVNWLANDGVWFQAVERRIGMFDAKRANDTCWTRFSPFEASRIKVLLDLPDRGGLEALKTALGYRLYSRVNVQEVVDEGPDSFVFRMVDCRVQSARTRKGLEEYPCKSVGVVEYRTFAETVDPRIRTECVGCPPDDHPGGWYCAWRFSLA
ncbi:MAG: cytosolic protein [Proteobacteria bacterium]|nr:cytosolic protein [Pseudomonadota bacterium]